MKRVYDNFLGSLDDADEETACLFFHDASNERGFFLLLGKRFAYRFKNVKEVDEFIEMLNKIKEQFEG